MRSSGAGRLRRSAPALPEGGGLRTGHRAPGRRAARPQHGRMPHDTDQAGSPPRGLSAPAPGPLALLFGEDSRRLLAPARARCRSVVRARRIRLPAAGRPAGRRGSGSRPTATGRCASPRRPPGRARRVRARQASLTRSGLGPDRAAIRVEVYRKPVETAPGHTASIAARAKPGRRWPRRPVALARQGRSSVQRLGLSWGLGARQHQGGQAESLQGHLWPQGDRPL